MKFLAENMSLQHPPFDGKTQRSSHGPTQEEMPGRKTFDAQGTQDVAGKLYSFAKGISRQPRQEGVEARAVDDTPGPGCGVVASDFRDEMRDDEMTWGFLHV